MNTRFTSLPVRAVLALALFQLLLLGAAAQTKKAPAKGPAAKSPAKTAPKPAVPDNLPKVTQVDAAQLKALLVPNGKPLLVNFWATWCDPCRDEFPDLVRIGADYKGKVDVITVSLDDLAELNRDVPKFLFDMKAEMPAFLLNTPDEDAVITSVSSEWQGGLPFTIVYDQSGATVYTRMGKFKTEIVRGALDKMLAPATTTSPAQK